MNLIKSSVLVVKPWLLGVGHPTVPESFPCVVPDVGLGSDGGGAQTLGIRAL